MKICAYCGHEEMEDAVRCGGCGTEFGQRTDAVKLPRFPWNWTWIRSGLLYLGACLVALLVYLLSLGPVLRYCGKVTSTTTTQTISYPTWIGVLYYPAFAVMSGGSLADVYHRYLEWWQRPQS